MRLISTKLCKTSDIGVNDNLFGGTMLAWLDEAGGILASCICHSPNVITLKMDQVVFKEPVKVKEQIRIYGKADRIGKTSVSIFLDARRVNFKTGDEVTVCSTNMIFVRIDEQGKPVEIKTA